MHYDYFDEDLVKMDIIPIVSKETEEEIPNVRINFVQLLIQDGQMDPMFNLIHLN